MIYKNKILKLLLLKIIN